MEIKVIVQAKKNLHNYRIIEKFISGIVLTGNEIKSIRCQQISINEAYIIPQNDELFISNMNISPYQYLLKDLIKSFDSKRKRKLLLKKQEIKKIIGKAKAKSYAIIPLKIFINNHGWAKLEIALAQHLKKYQIKQVIKEKDLKRRLKNELEDF